MLNTRWVSIEVDLLTIHDLRHILDEAVDDLEGLRCGSPSLVLRETIQSLQDRLYVLLSEDSPHKCNCGALNDVTR
jgi:hypothetical protein